MSDKDLRKKIILKKVKKMSLLISVLILLQITHPVVAQSSEVMEITSDAYDGAKDVIRRAYHAIAQIILRFFNLFTSAYGRLFSLLGLSPLRILISVPAVLIEDIFDVFAFLAKVSGTLFSVVLALFLLMFTSLNFLLYNSVDVLSIFLGSTTSLTPEFLLLYSREFVFLFMEGFNDPWPTLMSVWPEVDYYRNLIGPLSSLTSTMSQIGGGTTFTSILSILFLIPISLLVDVVGGLLNAIMHTRIQI